MQLVNYTTEQPIKVAHLNSRKWFLSEDAKATLINLINLNDPDELFTCIIHFIYEGGACKIPVSISYELQVRLFKNTSLQTIYRKNVLPSDDVNVCQEIASAMHDLLIKLRKKANKISTVRNKLL